MNALHSDFIQHYSTAVQMTIDTSGTAEPQKPAPAAFVKQNDAPPAPKAPAYGENVAAIEAQVKAGEVINLSDLSDAIKKDKAAAQTAQTAQQSKTGQTRTASKTKTAEPEKPSIREELAAGKKQLAAQKAAPVKAAKKDKNAVIGG